MQLNWAMHVLRECYHQFQVVSPETVHGLSKLFRNLKRGVKAILLALWLCFCIGFCLWEATNTVLSYLKFSVKTTSKVVEWGPEGIAFPAITICPTSAGRRSVLTKVPPLRQAVIITSTRVTDMAEISLMESMCTGNVTMAETVQLLTMIQSSTGVWSGVSKYQQMMVDSYSAVVNCKWNNQDLNCRRLFINKPTDSGYCFTFNIAENLLKAYGLVKPGDEYNSLNQKSYGTSVFESKPFVSKTTGLNSGISITLLSNTSEYCVSFMGYGGYVATIHDPSIEPLTWRQNGINLSPGWQTNVAMSITKTDRSKTASLGYCQSSLNLASFQAVVDYKSRDLYAVDCMIKKVVPECKCSPYYSPRGILYYFKDFPNVQFPYGNPGNYNETWIHTCGADVLNTIPSTVCQNQLEKNELRSDRSCYLDAPKPCEEIQISTTTTATRWPNPAYLPFLKRHVENTAGMSLEEFQQNFLSVNFFYESPQYTLVTETIKMTWVDLMNQVGGAMGMTLGLSLIGIVELFIWLIMRTIGRLPEIATIFEKQQFDKGSPYVP